MRGNAFDFVSNEIMNRVKGVDFEKQGFARANYRGYDAIFTSSYAHLFAIVRNMRRQGVHGNTKLVLGIRGAYGYERVTGFELDLVDAVILQSKWACNYVGDKVDHQHIFLVRDGIDHTLFRPMPKLRPKVFTLGWNGNKRSPVKRFGQIKRIFANYEHKMALWEPRKGKYQIPHLEMPKFYNEISCLVHLSTMESAPRPVIEAASCGRAVITTKTGFGQEIIPEEFHVEHAHQADELCKYFSEDLDECERVGARNRKIVEEKWTWDHNAQGYADFFMRLCNESLDYTRHARMVL